MQRIYARFWSPCGPTVLYVRATRPPRDKNTSEAPHEMTVNKRGGPPTSHNELIWQKPFAELCCKPHCVHTCYAGLVVLCIITLLHSTVLCCTVPHRAAFLYCSVDCAGSSCAVTCCTACPSVFRRSRWTTALGCGHPAPQANASARKEIHVALCRIQILKNAR